VAFEIKLVWAKKRSKLQSFKDINPFRV
jgi:hypothetical protein